MASRDVICRDAPTGVDVDGDADEVERCRTGGEQRTRLREGDRRHAVECAAAQADGDGGCKPKESRRGPGERYRTECGESFFDDERLLPGR